MTASFQTEPAGRAFRGGEIVSIQYLRAVAALLVVFHHARDQLPGPSHLITSTAGLGGVDIFFVISGFVMMYTTTHHDFTPLAFLRRRIVRIVPLYWLATLFTAITIFLLPHLTRDTVFTLGSLSSSLLFIPSINPGAPDQIAPMLKLGWTLNYEMYFYLLFSAALFLRPPLRFLLVSLYLAVAAAARLWLPHPAVAIVFWGTPIVYEFSAGCALAIFALRMPLPKAAAWILLAFGITSFFAMSHEPLGSFERLWIRGIPALLIVWSVVELDLAGLMSHRFFGLHFLGDASYAIYLGHLYPIILLRVIWDKFHLPQTPLWSSAFILMGVAGGIVVGCLVHIGVERPLGSFFKSRSRRNAPLPAS